MILSNSQQKMTAVEAADDGLPPDLVQWIARLRLLYGLPFNYLVPKNEFLPPETIRFFYVDPDWIAALADGALSIGRHYNGPENPPATIHSELVRLEMLHTEPAQEVHNIRREMLSLEAVPPPMKAFSENAPTGMMSGFLLNSSAVTAWKSMDVAGYAKGSSPYDYEQNPATTVESLTICRLERLSPTVILGLFQGSLFELVLHQPPEAIHFGFDRISVENSPNSVTKSLRVPKTNWDDPNATYDTNDYQNKILKDVFVDQDDRVLDMTALSKRLAEQLAAVPNGAPGYYSPNPTDNYKDHLVASDFALEMVVGVGLVSFINE